MNEYEKNLPTLSAASATRDRVGDPLTPPALVRVGGHQADQVIFLGPVSPGLCRWIRRLRFVIDKLLRSMPVLVQSSFCASFRRPQLVSAFPDCLV